MAFCQLVAVEDDFFEGIFVRAGCVRFGCGALAAVDGVLQAFFGAGVVPPGAVAVGDGDVGLLDVAEHLVVELVAQAGERRGDSVGVSVFGFEVLEDFGALFFAKPGVVVVEGDAVQDGLFWLKGDRGGQLAGPEWVREGSGSRSSPLQCIGRRHG